MDKNNALKNEFLSRIIEEVRNIPIEDVIGQEIELVRRGRLYDGLCPFHPDNHMGSFKIDPARNSYCCYSCGEYGDGIKFVMKTKELPFLKAIFDMAVNFGIITEDEYSQYSRRQYDPEVVKKLSVRPEKNIVKEEKRAPDRIISNVYSAMAKSCGLSEKHKEHLLKERHLKEDELGDFFTFPTKRTAIGKKIILCIRDTMAAQKGKSWKRLENTDKEHIMKMCLEIEKWLPYVPGFYLNSNGVLDFMSYSGIGILVRNEKGSVQGIQIRRDTIKQNEARYVWFSSAFAASDDKCSCGSGSGNPAGILFSKKKNRDKNVPFFITEGRFKAEALSAFGGDVVYLAGVNSWQPALNYVEKAGIKKVYIAFDADILGKVSVYMQACRLAEALKEKGVKTFIIIWPIERGKGFDDYSYNVGRQNMKKYVKNVPFDLFKKEYEEILKTVLSEFGVESPGKVPKDQVNRFGIILQKKGEKICGKKEEQQ